MPTGATSVAPQLSNLEEPQMTKNENDRNNDERDENTTSFGWDMFFNFLGQVFFALVCGGDADSN